MPRVWRCVYAVAAAVDGAPRNPGAGATVRGTLILGLALVFLTKM